MAIMRNISIRIDDATRDRLDQLASNRDRSRNWVVQEALAQYIHQQDEREEMIQEGLRDIEAGNVVSHEDVMAAVEAELQKAGL
jgi:predicted transcriptional regulator